MGLATSCAVSGVAGFLALLLNRKENTVRQQLREFCYEAGAKAGRQRREEVVKQCFAPLLTWVLDRSEGSHLALALDATTLGAPFVVLVAAMGIPGTCGMTHDQELLLRNGQRITWGR